MALVSESPGRLGSVATAPASPPHSSDHEPPHSPADDIRSWVFGDSETQALAVSRSPSPMAAAAEAPSPGSGTSSRASTPDRTFRRLRKGQKQASASLPQTLANGHIELANRSLSESETDEAAVSPRGGDPAADLAADAPGAAPTHRHHTPRTFTTPDIEEEGVSLLPVPAQMPAPDAAAAATQVPRPKLKFNLSLSRGGPGKKPAAVSAGALRPESAKLNSGVDVDVISVVVPGADSSTEEADAEAGMGAGTREQDAARGESPRIASAALLASLASERRARTRAGSSPSSAANTATPAVSAAVVRTTSTAPSAAAAAAVASPMLVVVGDEDTPESTPNRMSPRRQGGPTPELIDLTAPSPLDPSPSPPRPLRRPHPPSSLSRGGGSVGTAFAMGGGTGKGRDGGTHEGTRNPKRKVAAVEAVHEAEGPIPGATRAKGKGKAKAKAKVAPMRLDPPAAAPGEAGPAEAPAETAVFVVDSEDDDDEPIALTAGEAVASPGNAPTRARGKRRRTTAAGGRRGGGGGGDRTIGRGGHDLSQPFGSEDADRAVALALHYEEQGPAGDAAPGFFGLGQMMQRGFQYGGSFASAALSRAAEYMSPVRGGGTRSWGYDGAPPANFTPVATRTTRNRVGQVVPAQHWHSGGGGGGGVAYGGGWGGHGGYGGGGYSGAGPAETADYEQLLALDQRITPKGLKKPDLDRRTSVQVLKPEDIEKLSVKECVICLDEFKSKQKLRRLPCLCVFHPKCIDRFLKSATTCPICRQEV